MLETQPTVHASSSEGLADEREVHGDLARDGQRASGHGVDGSQPELLTADELARALKVSKAAVRAWQRQGVPFIPIGRLRRYVLVEVISWHRGRTGAQPINCDLRAAR